MPVPTGGRSEYEKTLSSELQKLHAVLLEQHQKDVEMKVKKAAAKALRGLSREAATSGSTAEERPPKTLEEIDNSVHEADFDESLTCQKWLEFSEKLLELESSSVTQVDEPIVEEDLQMRASWKISWQEASTIHRNRNFLPSTRSKSYSLRMNEVIRDYTCIGRMVLPPRSKQQMVWTFFGTMLILWDLITIPLEFFALGPYTTDVLGVMGRLSMAFWMIDMPMNLFFGIEKQGRTEMRVIELARAYLRSYFVLDVLVVSIDIALLLVEILGEDADGGFRSARFLRTMRLLRLLRLLRAVKLQQELTLLANRFLSVHVFMVAKVVLGLIMMLLINHIIACLWYGVGSWTLMETGQSWISLSALAEDQGNTKAGFFESYAASMHWTLTQFTPATNNIAPDNAFERLFAVWVILLAMGVFSSFISSITATVSSLRASQAKQFHERAALLRFFCERNLSADLFGKVNEVLRKEGMFQVRIQEQEVGLIKGIPETLLQQLHEEMYMSLMAHLPFWPEWAYGEDMHFLRIVCHFAMKEHIAKPMQDAFLPGRCSPEALIIETGHMCYIPAGSTRDIVVGEGDILCLASLWAEWQYHGRLTASYGSANYVGINSVTFCQLATEHGGPLWQYLQIFGILLLGLLESSGNAITDLIYKSSLMELGPRAEKYAAVFNARNARTKGFSRSQSGSKESITWSKNMVQTLETFEKFGSQSLGA